jgi:hypothetical protein
MEITLLAVQAVLLSGMLTRVPFDPYRSAAVDGADQTITIARPIPSVDVAREYREGRIMALSAESGVSNGHPLFVLRRLLKITLPSPPLPDSAHEFGADDFCGHQIDDSSDAQIPTDVLDGPCFECEYVSVWKPSDPSVVVEEWGS